MAETAIPSPKAGSGSHAVAFVRRRATEPGPPQADAPVFYGCLTISQFEVHKRITGDSVCFRVEPGLPAGDLIGSKKFWEANNGIER